MNNDIKHIEHCPLCGNANNCCYGKEKSLGDCWCTKEQFPQAIFDEMPEEQLYKTCICKQCLEKFKRTALS